MTRSGWILCAGVVLTPALIGAPLGAQQVSGAAATDTAALSLEAAIERAAGNSQEVRLARSRVQQAASQVQSVRSQALPQVNSSFGYNRTFASAFSGGGGGFTLPDSLRFEPNPNAPLEERVRYLERRVPTAGLGGLGQLFSDLPFGQANAYTLGVNGSQLLYSGGRIGAALAIARDVRQAAELQLAQQTSEIALQVRAAYYQALLAGQVESAAEAALAQAREFAEQERLRQSAGRSSELDVLRAEVAEANLRPQRVQARNQADLAVLNLKRLVDIPLGSPVRLTTPLVAPSAEELARSTPSAEFLAAQRAAEGAAERNASIAERNVAIQRGARLPNVSLVFNYGRVLYPSQVLDLGGDWRTDFTAGINLSVPVFNGFRTEANVREAREQLEQARIGLAQLREANQLLREQAEAERTRARAEIASARTTVAAAERVSELTRLRYQAGRATQLEVADARLALLQARVNLAQALATFYSADAQMAGSGMSGPPRSATSNMQGGGAAAAAAAGAMGGGQGSSAARGVPGAGPQ